MANEKKTDIFISKLLDNTKIDYTPNGSEIKEIQEALKTASKKGTGNAGFTQGSEENICLKNKKFV